MLDIVKGWIASYDLIRPGSRILAACSGGPDSLALVHMLNSLKEEYSFSLAVAHVNHMFRPEAAGEAEYVAAFSAGLGLVCHVTAIDVAAYAAANKLSSQQAGRLLRYQYLRSVAAGWGGARIATGHHRDDQVETVLLNLLRGAGSGGLRGMQPENGDIIRPFLAVSRRDIEAYCADRGLKPRYDSSNYKTNYLRNRVRLKLLPTLEADYNPAIRDALWRLSELAGDEYEYLSQEAAKLWGTVATAGDRVAIDGKALAGLHKALQRELIRQAIEKKRGDLTGISYGHVEKLLIMALTGTVGSVLTLPGGLTAQKTYSGLELLNSASDLKPAPFTGGFKPGEVAVPGATVVNGMKILAEMITGSPSSQGPGTAIFDLEQLRLPLVVRTRQPGDRFRPLGLGGSKKLKEFFIDNKIPEIQRDSIVLIADQQEIIWVAGYRQSEHGKVSANTQKKLQLSISNGRMFKYE